MAKTEQNLKVSEDFIAQLLAKNFGQKVRPEELRVAAEKLCEAVPGRAIKAA